MIIDATGYGGMSLSDRAEAVYRGALRPACRGIGIDQYVSGAYRRVAEATTDSERVEIGGAEATIATPTYRTLRQASDMPIKERAMLSDLLAELHPGDRVADIGAHIGIFSCLVANALRGSGAVVAFEAFPKNVDLLARNAGRNPGSITVRSVALSDSDGVERFGGARTEAGATTNALDPEADRGGFVVPTRTGDSVFADEPTPNIVKIDVEGAEQAVCEGMLETLSDPDCRAVYCEIHRNSLPEKGGDPDRVAELLREAGFELEVLDRKRDETYCLKGSK